MSINIYCHCRYVLGAPIKCVPFSTHIVRTPVSNGVRLPVVFARLGQQMCSYRIALFNLQLTSLRFFSMSSHCSQLIICNVFLIHCTHSKSPNKLHSCCFSSPLYAKCSSVFFFCTVHPAFTKNPHLHFFWRNSATISELFSFFSSDFCWSIVLLSLIFVFKQHSFSFDKEFEFI